LISPYQLFTANQITIFEKKRTSSQMKIGSIETVW